MSRAARARETAVTVVYPVERWPASQAAAAARTMPVRTEFSMMMSPAEGQWPWTWEPRAPARAKRTLTTMTSTYRVHLTTHHRLR